MDNLRDILAQRKPEEPPEIAIIKKYVQDAFQEVVGITVREHEIVIAAPGASLANTLRLRTLEIQKLIGSQKRLVFRIGN